MSPTNVKVFINFIVDRETEGGFQEIKQTMGNKAHALFLQWSAWVPGMESDDTASVARAAQSLESVPISPAEPIPIRGGILVIERIDNAPISFPTITSPPPLREVILFRSFTSSAAVHEYVTSNGVWKHDFAALWISRVTGGETKLSVMGHGDVALGYIATHMKEHTPGEVLIEARTLAFFTDSGAHWSAPWAQEVIRDYDISRTGTLLRISVTACHGGQDGMVERKARSFAEIFYQSLVSHNIPWAKFSVTASVFIASRSKMSGRGSRIGVIAEAAEQGVAISQRNVAHNTEIMKTHPKLTAEQVNQKKLLFDADMMLMDWGFPSDVRIQFSSDNPQGALKPISARRTGRVAVPMVRGVNGTWEFEKFVIAVTGYFHSQTELWLHPKEYFEAVSAINTFLIETSQALTPADIQTPKLKAEDHLQHLIDASKRYPKRESGWNDMFKNILKAINIYSDRLIKGIPPS